MRHVHQHALLSDSLLPGLVTEENHAVAKAAVFQKLQLQADIVGKELFAASHYDGYEQQMALVDQSGSEGVGGWTRAAYENIMPGSFPALLDVFLRGFQRSCFAAKLVVSEESVIALPTSTNREVSPPPFSDVLGIVKQNLFAQSYFRTSNMHTEIQESPLVHPNHHFSRSTPGVLKAPFG